MTVTTHLAALEAGGLVSLAQLQPEVEYLFRHALIQETAYDSLVRADRRMLHQIIGESLERLYPARLDSPEVAPMLAHHFGEAGDFPRALRYYTLAGRSATEVHANAEAVHFFGHALEIAQALPADGETVADLYLRRGRALELNARDAEALTNYEAMAAWAVSQGDRSAQLAALAARATIYVKPSVEANLPLGYELSQEALALARDLGDRPAEAKVLWNLLQYYLATLQLDEARGYGERALEIGREHGLREQVAYVLTDLVKLYFQMGDAERARDAMEEARSIWRELGVLNMLADNLSTAALMHIVLGEYERGLAYADEALQVSRAIGNLWNQSYSRYIVDMVHFERGDIGQALEVAEQCLRLAEQAGFAEGVIQATFDVALFYGYMGALPRAFELAHRLQARADAQAGAAHSSPLAEGLIAFLHLLGGRPAEARATLAEANIPEDEAELRDWFYLTYMFVTQIRAELALAEGDYLRAIALSENLLPYLKENGVRLFTVDILHLRGRGLWAAGRAEEAGAALAAARAEAEDLGSRRSLWQILADLADLEAERGNAQAALALRRQAAEIVEYIAAHAGRAELRQSFLGQPRVRGVLEQG